MIGLVIVSHSAKLAEGVCELASQVAQGRVRVAAAGGTSDPDHPLGTDAFRVLEAIESVYDEDGVVLLVDLGSAVLSAETALELLDEPRRRRVRLSTASLVEGAVEAATLAAAGADIDEIVRSALEEPAAVAPGAGDVEARVTLVNPAGLHARPAARLVRLAREFDAHIMLENVTAGRGPADAASINSILRLEARQGHSIAIHGAGVAAREAVAELATFVEGGCGDTAAALDPAAAGEVRPVAADGMLTGIAAARGIAIGPLAQLDRVGPTTVPREAASVDAEIERLRAALSGASEETRTLYAWARSNAGENQAGIFDAQLLFLDDPELTGDAIEKIRAERISAEAAWDAVIVTAAERLAALEDSYLRARAADVRDAGERVLRRLTGASARPVDLREPSVLAVRDLTPSQVQELNRDRVLGLCFEYGSASAHSVILARAMAIPTVVGMGPALGEVPEGTRVALDGERGTLLISPDAWQVRELEERRRSWLELRRLSEAQRTRPAATRDGRRIRVVANISAIEEAAPAVAQGAEGVGVLRTEFLFLGRTRAPGEKEQLEAYRAIADGLGARPLVIRTLDIGGDKQLPYVDIGEEANPFLGWRGVRLTLGRPDLLHTQLRAILRAGFQRDVGILLPMVSSLAEVRAVKAMLLEVAAELDSAGLAYRRDTPLGVMIEVPAAVAIARELAREVSFFSIGSNDLVQYVMVADRTNARVASMADPYQPAVLRTIQQAAEAGRAAGIPVALCGELGADTRATPLLIGLGLDELSVSAPLIAELKTAIARWTLDEAREIARQALAMESAEAVRGILERAAAG